MYEILFMARSFRTMGWPILGLTIIHNLIPWASRAYDDRPIFGTSWNEYLFIISSFALNSYTFYFNSLFVSFNYTDFQRKKVMMEAMSSYIDVRHRDRSPYSGYLPVMNAYCPCNLYSWFNTR
jgi:hypothetical protein